MSLPIPLILVGTGEYYRKILVPALRVLASENIAVPLLTVDVRERNDDTDTFFSSVPHRIRKAGEKLSNLLEDVKHLDPVVILGHANQLHVSDALNLLGAGFQVLIEKPYTLSSEELSTIERVIEDESSRIGLIEYYLTMKSAPLFALTKQLDDTSFFFTDGLIVQTGTREGVPSPSIETIGKIESVTVDVLEGEGTVGRLDHRGVHLIEREKGGGMIHDLGIHAIAPLIPLSDIIGELLPATVLVRTAHSKEYVKMAEEQFGLLPHKVGESYAEISLSTSKGIPVVIRIGKYVCENKNQRALTITGKDGSLVLDLSDPHISLSMKSEINESLYSLPKTNEKYYSVLRASLLELKGESPYSFSISRASLKAQALVLHVAALVQDRGIEKLYDSGLYPDEIF